MAKRETNEATECLAAAIRDTLSPETVATIAAHLGTVTTKKKSVNAEAEWFRSFLVDLLGVEEYDATCDELGL